MRYTYMYSLEVSGWPGEWPRALGCQRKDCSWMLWNTDQSPTPYNPVHVLKTRQGKYTCKMLKTSSVLKSFHYTISDNTRCRLWWIKRFHSQKKAVWNPKCNIRFSWFRISEHNLLNRGSIIKSTGEVALVFLAENPKYLGARSSYASNWWRSIDFSGAVLIYTSCMAGP